MGLSTVEVEEVPFDLETDKDKIDLTANEASITNIRIWDPSPAVLGKTFPQLQRVRDYYRINDVDVDRYELNGTPTQVVLSVRDLNTANVPRDTWAAKHLTYTHGYGVIVAPANAKEASGEPSFVAKDVPYVSEVEELAAHAAGRVLRRGPEPVRRHRLEAAGAELPGGRGHAVRRLRGARRRDARQPPQASRVRAALRRRQPADLRPAHRQLEDPVHPRHQGAGVGARPVPPLRRRPVPRDQRRTHQVDHRRLHHHEPLPLRRARRHRRARRTAAGSTTASTTCGTR